MTSPNDAAFEDVGFDVSHNNAGLDFGLLKTSRRVCFHKLTEGTGFVDPSFVPNVQKMIDLDCGFKLAAYHFAHGDDPLGQVDHFLQSFVEETGKLSYVPEFLFMFDFERSANPPTEGVARAMVSELAANGVPNPIIYCGYDFFSTTAPLGQATHFLAAYTSRPRSALPWRLPSASIFGFDWWQYTGDALGPWAKDISGGSRGMDLSCFNRAKHGESFDTWWDAELAKQTQPS